MAKIQKGWLKTREGEYFSPITLAENIYSRDGKKYDDVIKGYINDVTGDQSELGQKIDDLYERLKNFNGSDADTFYIVDNQGNIIFKIDAQGAHSTNFTSLDGNLNQVIADLAKETANRNQQYLLLTNKDIELANLVNSNKTEIDDIQAKIRNFKNEEDDEVLYITDATGNIIAKIDNEGVQSINFKSLNGDLNETISKLNEEVELRNNQFINLSNKDIEIIEKVNLNVTNIEDIYNKIRNFKNEEDDDTFYITDSEGNVIFKVLDGGVYTTNLNTLKYDVNATLDRLFIDLNKEIDDRKTSIQAVENSISASSSKLNTLIGEDSDKSVREIANETLVPLSEQISNLDKKIDQETTNRGNEDKNLKDYVDSAKEELQGNISSVSSKVNTLVDGDSDKSVRDIANEELATQLLSGKADADFKTLQELAAWLEGHPEDVSAINLAISVLQKQLKGFSENENSVLDYIDNLDSSLQSIINDRLKNFDGNDNDVLYITDNDGNIIAKVDNSGVQSINFITNQYDVNDTLFNLNEKIDQEILDRQDSDNEIVGYVDGIKDSLQNSINASNSKLNTLIGSDSDKSVSTIVDEKLVPVEKEISDLDKKIDQEIVDRGNEDKDLSDYVDSVKQELQNSISASNSKLNILIGEDSNKSTRTIANEELAAQLLSGKADADFKTLQQLAAWLEDHPEDVADINLAISILQGQLNGFEETEGSVLSHVNNLDSSLQSIINDRLKNFDGNDNDVLYITDNDGNIIAQFDQNGLFVKDVKIQNGKTLQRDSLFYSIENYKEINI